MKKWDIVLVPFPFTDLSKVKRRPALIVSPEDYNNGPDIVIAFITSQISSYRFGDYQIKKWASSGLPKPSLVRMKFATIDKQIIVKKLGRLSPKDVGDFCNLLTRFFADE